MFIINKKFSYLLYTRHSVFLYWFLSYLPLLQIVLNKYENIFIYLNVIFCVDK